MHASRVSRLLSRWQESFEQGIDLTAVDLCPDEPELAQRLEPALEKLRQVKQMLDGLGADESAARTGEAPTIPPPQVDSAITMAPDPIGEPVPLAPSGNGIPHPTQSVEDGRLDAVRVPGYQLLDELGRGGMGVVYKARQVGLGRIVALKMILAGGHAGTADLARFRIEGEAIARLRHPNIVQVYEVGEQEGMPFFSLEYCEGGSLDRKLAGNPMPPEKAAVLVEELARAMHAAHRASVIHRDLKPANVLLTADGTPKISDFGLAKKLDEASQTQTGAVMGTPSYMAPEQAESKKDVGPAADVYSLGAILYECLTGRPPFRAATPLDTILQVLSSPAVPPAQLNRGVSRDLDTICLKCLHKESSRRYESAQALAEDLRRFVEGSPILARPVSALERAWAWAWRNPTVAGLAAALLLTLMSGLVGVTRLWLLAENNHQQAEHNLGVAEENRQRAEASLLESNKQRVRAERGELVARQHYYVSNLQLAHQAWKEGHLASMHDLLRRHEPGSGVEDLRGFEWYHLQELPRSGSVSRLQLGAPIVGLVELQEGRTLAAAKQDGAIVLMDEAGRQVQTLQPTRAGLGFAYEPVKQGLALVRVIPGSPAEKAGLNVGQTISSVKDLSGAWVPVAGKDAQTQVALFRRRAGERVELEIRGPGDAPSARVTLVAGTILDEDPIQAVAADSRGRWLVVGHSRAIRLWDAR
jgi:hypothetical protein